VWIAGIVLISEIVLVVLFLNALRVREEDLYEDGYSVSKEDLQKAKFLRAVDSLSPPESEYSQAFYDSLDSQGLWKRLGFYKTLDPEELRKELRKSRYDDD